MLIRKICYFIVGCILFTSKNCNAAIFDWKTAHAAVYLSSQAYCQSSEYFIQNFLTSSDSVEHINATNHYFGLIGFSQNTQTIFIVFRGTRKVQEYLIDSDNLLVSYPYCTNCKVHKGFYTTERNLVEEALEEVRNLVSQYPDYRIVVTGHSSGGAVGLLFTVDLIYSNILQNNTTASNLQLITFGSPRVGNAAFAMNVSSLLPSIYRVTHYKEMPVHYPLSSQYMHTSGEWYEDNKGTLTECIGYEDPICSMKWPVLSTTIGDHYRYLGHYVKCNESDPNDIGAYPSQDIDKPVITITTTNTDSTDIVSIMSDITADTDTMPITYSETLRRDKVVEAQSVAPYIFYPPSPVSTKTTKQTPYKPAVTTKKHTMQIVYGVLILTALVVGVILLVCVFYRQACYDAYNRTHHWLRDTFLEHSREREGVQEYRHLMGTHSNNVPNGGGSGDGGVETGTKHQRDKKEGAAVGGSGDYSTFHDMHTAIGKHIGKVSSGNKDGKDVMIAV